MVTSTGRKIVPNMSVNSSERLLFYYFKEDILKYLKTTWPDIEPSEFDVRLGNSSDRYIFYAPRLFTQQDWDEIRKLYKARFRSGSSTGTLSPPSAA